MWGSLVCCTPGMAGLTSRRPNFQPNKGDPKMTKGEWYVQGRPTKPKTWRPTHSRRPWLGPPSEIGGWSQHKKPRRTEMGMNGKRRGVTYRFDPVLIDRTDPPVNVRPGDLVRIKDQHGCPPAGTMGMCHVVHADTGEFAGLVCLNSLQPVKETTHARNEKCEDQEGTENQGG